MDILIPVSVGELIDKITILRIKSERLKTAGLDNVRHELALLQDIFATRVEQTADLERLVAELARVNEILWDIEDAKRDCERTKTFDDRFTQLARSVYIENDKRARIKRSINQLTKSSIVEEKSYGAY
jgi:hypothetical protein